MEKPNPVETSLNEKRNEHEHEKEKRMKNFGK